MSVKRPSSWGKNTYERKHADTSYVYFPTVQRIYGQLFVPENGDGNSDVAPEGGAARIVRRLQ